MLYWAAVFLIIAIVAGVLGLTGVAGTAMQIAWILFVVGLILAVVFLVLASPRSWFQFASMRSHFIPCLRGPHEFLTDRVGC
jgi:uncharacterized membrane protein YtjA (UPF0391 family)